MSKKTPLVPQSQAGGGVLLSAGGDVNTEVLQALCDKLETLIEVSNDATILNEIVNNLQALIEGQGDVITELMALCDKILQNNEDNTQILESLTALCEKLETLIENSDLSDYKVIKESGIPGADYNGAFRYINGRPPASSAWALIDNRDPLNQVTVASGANLNAFTADLESKGFTEWSTNEEHWVCPCPEGLTTESTGAYFVTVDGETSAKLVCTPIAEVPDVPEAKIVDNTAVCALRTIGCNDDRRDDLLQDILTALTAPCPECVKCPELIVGAAEFTTESANGLPGSAVSFPVTTPLNETSDFSVPIALPEADCFTDPEATIVVRWCFDHEIDASSSHTGFNVSGSDGTAAIGTIVGQSATGTTNVGPGATPHTGPRDKYWVDIEFTVGQLQAGLALQTSAFGAIIPEQETIYSQDVSIKTDLAELGCC